MQKIKMTEEQKDSNSTMILYCTDCGLMRLKDEIGNCTRCSGQSFDSTPPKGKTILNVNEVKYFSLGSPNHRAGLYDN